MGEVRKIKNLYHFLKAVYWTYRCGWPAKKLYVVGVTGTDGKTTTCTLIYEMLKAAGYKTGLLTTVSAKIGDPSASSGQVDEMETGLHTTNPDPSLLQPILKKAVERGITHMVLEVTSHGLDQNRVWGCNFRIGVLTNITHEHLDYHGTMERYKQAKLKLFRGVEYAVLNQDDSSYENFKFSILNPPAGRAGFKSNFKPQIIKYSRSKLKDISPALVGDYNRYNISAAVAVAKILKIQDSVINKVVREFMGVPGRREEVKEGQGFRLIVDFAHTPNALEQVLLSLRKQSKSKTKIIVVFGCTGERDKEKRPMMGEIATRLADEVIITSDDTRSESQDEIARQILAGVPPSNLPPSLGGRSKERGIQKVWVENDRRRAIEIAIKLARPGDTVLLAGKGHEKTILHGTTEFPWSDADEAKKAIRNLPAGRQGLRG